MQLTRRNTLFGLGTIIGSGGAIVGSGALSQTEAQRSITVEVVDDENVAEEFVDILLDTSSEHVDVDGETDAADLFPTGDDLDSYADHESELEDTDVSLVTNEIGIVFSGLLGGSTTTFDDLFKVVNESGDDSDDFTVTFERNEGSLIGGFEGGETEAPVDVDTGEFATQGIEIDASGVDGQETEDDALLIRIEAQDA